MINFKDQYRSEDLPNIFDELRRKIELDPKQPQHLTTIRGAGYRLLSEP